MKRPYKLAFAVAVHVGPEILIIDEALSVGDARFAAKCIKKIREMREGGTTLLFVSHDVGIVRTLVPTLPRGNAGASRQLPTVVDSVEGGRYHAGAWERVNRTPQCCPAAT